MGTVAPYVIFQQLRAVKGLLGFYSHVTYLNRLSIILGSCNVYQKDILSEGCVFCLSRSSLWS